jgi:hypothetical protein
VETAIGGAVYLEDDSSSCTVESRTWCTRMFEKPVISMPSCLFDQVLEADALSGALMHWLGECEDVMQTARVPGHTNLQIQ